MEQVVVDMHTKSGLLEQIEVARSRWRKPGSDAGVHQATRAASRATCRCAATPSAWIAASSPPTCPRSRTTCTTAASTSAASKSSSAAGTPASSTVAPQGGRHRALDDIRESVAELRSTASTSSCRRVRRRDAGGRRRRQTPADTRTAANCAAAVGAHQPTLETADGPVDRVPAHVVSRSTAAPCSMIAVNGARSSRDSVRCSSTTAQYAALLTCSITSKSAKRSGQGRPAGQASGGAGGSSGFDAD